MSVAADHAQRWKQRHQKPLQSFPKIHRLRWNDCHCLARSTDPLSRPSFELWAEQLRLY
jgi:hypothetical protein